MKKFNYLIIAVFALCFTACGGKKESSETIPEQEDSIESVEAEPQGEMEQTLCLEGGIGKYPIMMTIHIASDGEVTGAYYYKKQGPGNYLYLKGTKSDNRVTLCEFTKDGQQTGNYDGVLNDGVFTGNFNTKSGYYDFTLNPTNIEPIDFSDIDFSVFVPESVSYNDTNSGVSNNYSSESVGSEDWDSLLDSYEQYVEQYISYVRKAADGDASALAEYPSLMRKAKEYGNKLQGAEGTMSASQWARYIEITNRMVEAAQELQR